LASKVTTKRWVSMRMPGPGSRESFSSSAARRLRVTVTPTGSRQLGWKRSGVARTFMIPSSMLVKARRVKMPSSGA
jgi:hypothetical protein